MSYLWLADLNARTVYRAPALIGLLAHAGVYSDETEARIEPFDAMSLDVASWWSSGV